MKRFLYKVKKSGEVFTGTVINFEDGKSLEEQKEIERIYLENLSKEKGKKFIFKEEKVEG